MATWEDSRKLTFMNAYSLIAASRLMYIQLADCPFLR